MNKLYIQNQKFEKKDFTSETLPKGEYENCNFINCNFANADLSDNNFSGCNFSSCNISMVRLAKSVLSDVAFIDCKLLGTGFENCSSFTFSVKFENCLLNLSSFYKMNLKKTLFKNCSLHEVDFTEADLSAAVFDMCDLFRAIFKSTNIEKADLRTALNYSIDPEINKIKKSEVFFGGSEGIIASV